MTTHSIMARALSENLPTIARPANEPVRMTGDEMIERLNELVEKMMGDGMSYETASLQAANLLAMEAGQA